MKPIRAAVAHLSFAWLSLLGLTALSLLLGYTMHGKIGLQILVAGLLWLKAWIVARDFMEIGACHAFIRRVVYGFIAVTPLCIALLGYYGAQFARWACL
ncbi:MAG: hypothetical protein U1F63_03285 [Chitinivorax sp.]